MRIKCDECKGEDFGIYTVENGGAMMKYLVLCNTCNNTQAEIETGLNE